MNCIISSTFKNNNLVAPKNGIVDIFGQGDNTKLSIKVKKDKIFYDDDDNQYDYYFHQVISLVFSKMRLL